MEKKMALFSNIIHNLSKQGKIQQALRLYQTTSVSWMNGSPSKTQTNPVGRARLEKSYAVIAFCHHIFQKRNFHRESCVLK